MHLTSAQVAHQFGADPRDIAAVRQFARNNGLFVVRVHPARRTVVLGGTVSRMQAAFGVDLGLFTSQHKVFRGRSGPVHVPDWLHPAVTAVLGLDNRPQARPHFRAGRVVGQFAPRSGPAGSFTARRIAQLYNFPVGDGAGQTIGIVELGGGYRQADLATYFSGLGLSVPTVVDVSVDGGVNQPTGDPNSADGEVALDIEVAGAVAPKSKIVVYFAPNTDQGFVDSILAATHDQTNRPSILSISWGSAESNWSQQALTAMNQALQAAVATGLTVYAAAGDNGSGDGVGDGVAHADFPASSPNAVGCGGTFLQASGGQIASEVTWNAPGDGATGGGVSDRFPVPPYQLAINPTSANPPHGHGRGVPDVAGDADPRSGYQVVVDGQATVIGGTSAVAPLWAGLTALLQQKLGHPLAPIHPQLYQATAAFRDITSGSNGAYQAAAGWDACTGLGSPRGKALLAAAW